MTELDFLSPEVENEAEIDGEDLESPDKTASGLPNGVGVCVDCASPSYESEYQNGDGKETVEICQKTVNPHNRVSSENFNIQRVIGKGGYGKVFLVQKVDGVDKGKLYAMKVLKKARLVCNEKDKAHTVSERNILEMLRHPFLVRLHYAFQNHSNLYIVLEYCPGGELFNYLEREGALLENAACFYAAEIVLAIGHLHSLGIIYRDLKSENVLLDRQGHVKLTDFGLSKEGVCTTNTFCGTIEYMAPEIIKYEGHGKAVDWWSLGTLLFDMLSGGPPFSQEESREATTHKILTAPLKFPPSFSPEVTSLIKGLLKRDPRERLGSKDDVEEVKRHKFFRRHEINWSDVYNRRLKPPFKPHLVADNDTSMFDPTFTRLQPIVSPSDAGRSIPTDMFQGFSYVAQSVCEDSERDTWAEPNSSSRRRHHGDRAALSAGRLRRLGAVPCLWPTKAENHKRNGHTAQPDLATRPVDPDRTSVTPNTVINGLNATCTSGLKIGNGFVTPLVVNQCLKPVPSLPPSNSQATLVGQNSDSDMLCTMDTVVDNNMYSHNISDTSQNGIARTTNLTRPTEQEAKKHNEHTDDVVDEDEDDDEDDEEEELEEENVPGAKQIHQGNGCSFYIPPNPAERGTNQEVLAFNFTTGPLNEERLKAFHNYPVPMMHSVSGNQLRLGTTQSAAVLNAMPAYPAQRSHVDLKTFGQQNKASPGHLTGRLVHSTDQLGTLHQHGASGAVNANRRLMITQLALPTGTSSKAPNLGASRMDVSPISSGANGVIGNQTSITTTSASVSPYQNASGKCCVM